MDEKEAISILMKDDGTSANKAKNGHFFFVFILQMLLVLTSYIYGHTNVVNVQHLIFLLWDMIINVGHVYLLHG